MNLPLFDPPALVAFTTSSDSSASTEAPKRAIRVLADDVMRIIEAKAGRFREVRDGQVTREYSILELHTGAFVFEFDDGSRVPAPRGVTRTWISDGLHFETMREFR